MLQAFGPESPPSPPRKTPNNPQPEADARASLFPTTATPVASKHSRRDDEANLAAAAPSPIGNVKGKTTAGTQILEAVSGRTNRSCSSCTFHSKTEFDDGMAAHTRKGLVGTGASEVKIAGPGQTKTKKRMGPLETSARHR